MGVPFTDPHAAVTVERLGSQLLGVVEVAQEEGRLPDSHRPGIAGVANVCCCVGVHAAEQDAAGFVAVTGPGGFVADGGEGGLADPNAVKLALGSRPLTSGAARNRRACIEPPDVAGSAEVERGRPVW